MSSAPSNGRGYVKMPRSLAEDPLFRDPKIPKAWGRVFQQILWSAKWKPFVTREGLTISPGSLPTSRKALAKLACCTEQQVRGAITYLTKSRKITVVTTRPYMVLSVLNWASYQGRGSDDNQQHPYDNQAGNQANNQRDNQPGNSSKPLSNGHQTMSGRYGDNQPKNEPDNLPDSPFLRSALAEAKALEKYVSAAEKDGRLNSFRYLPELCGCECEECSDGDYDELPHAPFGTDDWSTACGWDLITATPFERFVRTYSPESKGALKEERQAFYLLVWTPEDYETVKEALLRKGAALYENPKPLLALLLEDCASALLKRGMNGFRPVEQLHFVAISSPP